MKKKPDKIMKDGRGAWLTVSKYYYARREPSYDNYTSIFYYDLEGNRIPLASGTCPKCGDFIESKMCGDLVCCSCGGSFVDTSRWSPERHRLGGLLDYEPAKQVGGCGISTKDKKCIDCKYIYGTGCSSEFCPDHNSELNLEELMEREIRLRKSGAGKMEILVEFLQNGRLIDYQILSNTLLEIQPRISEFFHDPKFKIKHS